MITQQTHSGTLDPSPSLRELTHAALARAIAAEGAVLLKNDGLLPLSAHTPLALLGAGAVKTVKGGTGSGDVNNRASVSIWQALEEAQVPLVSGDWLADYERRYDAARQAWKTQVLTAARHYDNPFDAYAEHPFALPDGRPVAQGDVAGAAAAVYVVSRISGGGRDRRLTAGDYYLSAQEWADLRLLDRLGLPTVLVLNAGGPVELTDALEQLPSLRAVLSLSQPGQEGGRAAADVLLGAVSPSGRLTATWARRYQDYPGADSFGYLNGDVSCDTYHEGIFMGYRFFDAFDVEPLFPFGFGLSYAEFDLSLSGAHVQGDSIQVWVQVANRSPDRAGKEVVQLYLTLPDAGLWPGGGPGDAGKAHPSLAGPRHEPAPQPAVRAQL